MSFNSNGDAKWCRRRDGRFLGSSGDGDVEGGARDVVLTPLDHQDVVAPFLQYVADVVLQVAHVFDQHLLTGDLWAVHAHQEHVLTWEEVEEQNASVKLMISALSIFVLKSMTAN